MSGSRNRKINRFEIWLISLEPTVGSEISKTRPCLVISPYEINVNLNTIIVAPITHTKKNYPTRLAIKLNNQEGEIALDQIRTVDKLRFIHKITELKDVEAYLVCEKLQEIFEY